jgi:hypothetical protein
MTGQYLKKRDGNLDWRSERSAGAFHGRRMWNLRPLKVRRATERCATKRKGGDWGAVSGWLTGSCEIPPTPLLMHHFWEKKLLGEVSMHMRLLFGRKLNIEAKLIILSSRAYRWQYCRLYTVWIAPRFRPGSPPSDRPTPMPFHPSSFSTILQYQ